MKITRLISTHQYSQAQDDDDFFHLNVVVGLDTVDDNVVDSDYTQVGEFAETMI